MSQTLHTSLLRVAVLHILRAAGFHSTKPSVLDVVVNLAERYMLLLATTTATHASLNHNTPAPTITDVRMALADCGLLLPDLGGAEEEWKERMRRPLSDYQDLPYGERRRPKIAKSRQDEDTRDVREFLDWIKGDRIKEMQRIAGTLPDTGLGLAPELMHKEDYLTALKKKHSKTGEEARYAGTVLGKRADDKKVTIEGGPTHTLREWDLRIAGRAQDVATSHDEISKEASK